MTKARLFIGLGALLMIGSFIYLMVGVTVQGSPFSASLFQGLFCGPDETLKVELGNTFYDVSNNMTLQDTTYVCVNAAGEARNVSQQFFYTLLASYVIPFLIGLGLLLFGLNLLARKNDREATARAALDTPKPEPAGGDFGHLDDILQVVSDKLAAAGEPLTGSVTDRLQQLEAAHKRQLISGDEYRMASAALFARIGKE